MTNLEPICSAPDLSPHILQLLNEFVYQLVCSGQLMMAKLLRNNILEKVRFISVTSKFVSIKIAKLKIPICFSTDYGI